MRRLLIAALLLVSVFALGQDRNRRTLGRNGSTTASSVVLAFAPAAGTGLQSVADLCDTYSTDMTGAYFCLRGDGTSLNGSQTLTAIAAPTTASGALCPNGTDCTAVTSSRFNGTTQFYETANAASPTGDFSVCAVMSSEDATPNPPLVAKDDGATRVFYLRQASDSSGNMCVLKAGGTSTCVSTTAATAPNYAWNLVCATYDYVADGSSILTTYVNGTAGTPSTTAVGPPATGSSKFNIAGYGFGTLKGRLRGAFYTEKVLSAQTISNMARTVLADAPTGTLGETLTFTRASVKFCPNAAGTEGSWLPVNRPCISGGGIYAEGAATNIQIRSQEFDNVAWTKLGATVTANTTDVAAPDGTYTAEKVDLVSTAGAGSTAFVYKGNAATVAAYSQALYLRSSAATATVYLYYYDGTTYKKATCALTNTAWMRCLNENQTLTVTTWNFTFGVDRNDLTQSAQPAQTVYAWQADHTLGPLASSTIVTAGTSVTRSAELASFATPTGLTDVAGCVGATFLVSGHNPAVPQRLITFDSGTAVTPMYLSSSTVLQAYDGLNFTQSPSAAWANVATYVASGWAGSTVTFYRGGLTTTGIYDGSWPVGVAVYLGTNSNGYLGGTLSNVKIGRTTGGCL